MVRRLPVDEQRRTVCRILQEQEGRAAAQPGGELPFRGKNPVRVPCFRSAPPDETRRDGASVRR
jgi:hypothetical protein